MSEDQTIEGFLNQYQHIYDRAQKLRQLIFASLPGITEQLDLPAKMIMYCYGQKYSEMICTIIPSKTGLKLGFYKGVDLPDPHSLLEGKGKISRYVEIKSDEQIKSPALKALIESGLKAFGLRMNK